jgi:hypothetical protein
MQNKFSGSYTTVNAHFLWLEGDNGVHLSVVYVVCCVACVVTCVCSLLCGVYTVILLVISCNLLCVLYVQHTQQVTDSH